MSNVLWGPLFIALDGSPENGLFGWIMAAVIAGAALSFPIRPNAGTAWAAIMGACAWLWLGVLGAGINV